MLWQQVAQTHHLHFFFYTALLTFLIHHHHLTPQNPSYLESLLSDLITTERTTEAFQTQIQILLIMYHSINQTIWSQIVAMARAAFHDPMCWVFAWAKSLATRNATH